MDKTMQAALMADFNDEQMGHKPATWCRACTDAVRSRQGKSCGEHKAISCPKCKTKITEAHVCLTFVGHADVRARLCEVDPEWSWAPFEFPGTGSLILSTDGSPVGLWIHLTVGGVTKPGYGSVDKGKAEAVKELIGDALRNAGLSFGIAWKLWAKGERSGAEGSQDAGAEGSGGTQSAGDAWDKAQPTRPAQPAQRNGNGNGQVARPAQRQQQGAPAKDTPPDPDAQPYADEAAEARTIAALKDIHVKAREAHKLASVIRNPSGEGTGGLGQYLNWRKKQLEDETAALAELQQAANGMEAAALDAHVKHVTGADLEGATAAQLRQAAEALKAGAPA